MVAGEAEATEIAHLADGSLETARQLLDPQLREQRKVLYDMLAAEPFPSAQLAAAMIEGLATSEGEKSSQRASAGWVVRFSIEFYRRALLRLTEDAPRDLEIPQVARFADRLTGRSFEALDRVGDMLERCVVADRHLDSNVAVPLCLETLFDDLGRLLRA
jgi:DNA polymerase-3 subunit delta'